LSIGGKKQEVDNMRNDFWLDSVKEFGVECAALYDPEKEIERRMTKRKAGRDSEYDECLLRLGERIKEYRLQRGWSQHYVCMNFNFYESHWRLLEKGKVMSVPSLFRIAKMFGIEASELLAGLSTSNAPETGENSDASTAQTKNDSPGDSGEAISK
jgi:ribosome-binding protein aMBF1 (putative translation factor)